jgi:hypothetical protein
MPRATVLLPLACVCVCVCVLLPSSSPATGCLHVPLAPVAGFYFLYYLQQLVGGPAAFEPFMRHYLDTFAFGAVDSTQFRRAFCDFFRDAPAGVSCV